MMVQAPSFVQL